MPRSKRRGKGGKGAFSNKGMQSYVSRMKVMSIPFRVTQTTSGTGGLTSVESSASLSSANSTSLDPYTIGGRMLLLTNNYLQYRVIRGTLKYVPDGTSSGVGEIVAGGTTTPTYGDRSFAMGIFIDPALSTISYENIYASGGIVGNTSRGHSLSIPASGWLYTSTTSASPTTIDLRMTAFGKVYFAYFTASTTSAYSYGQLLLDIEFEVRGAVDNAAALGLSTTNPSGINVIQLSSYTGDSSSRVGSNFVEVQALTGEVKKPTACQAGQGKDVHGEMKHAQAVVEEQTEEKDEIDTPDSELELEIRNLSIRLNHLMTSRRLNETTKSITGKPG